MPSTLTRQILALATAATLAAVGRPVLAQQATTTGAVRGTVVGADGTPVAGAAVVTVNAETGVRRGTQTDDAGRYRIPFLDPGRYSVRAQRIGYRPAERTDVRIGLGQLQDLDFRLEAAATQLEAVTVSADVVPLIETTKTGTSARIDDRQIAQLPTNGRNFKDLVVLAPGTSDVSGGGAGGGQSIGGGRTAASSLLVDGVNNNESFFGGDARGGDRAPFSYSIEAVKEIQVITAGYDVERGNFTGGTVNAVTKSGTNLFRGTAFGFLRADEAAGVQLTGRDFLNNSPLDFRSQQYGLALGGPIVKDRAHFFFTVDRQTRRDPRPAFATGAGTFDPTSSAFRFPQATFDTIVNVARDSLGYDLTSEFGNFVQNVNETALFGRIDWQLGERNTLTVRNNYMRFEQRNDRLVTAPSSFGDFLSNGGPYKTSTNSIVTSLTSTFGGGLSNELRAQVAYEHKPRPSNPSGGYGVPLPQVTIQGITSRRADNTTRVTGVNFGADPVLHSNLLDQDTYELIDNLRYTRGDHTFKVGGNLLRVNVLNDFFFNALGSFTYPSLTAFARNQPSSYTRALEIPGQGKPVADFAVNEAAVYAQDEWQVTPKLFLSYGLRYDVALYPDAPVDNPDVSAAFAGIRTSTRPKDYNNVSPRVGFTFDPGANGLQVLRGGSGIFYGRSPYVLYANVLTNTGRTQLSLTCSGAAVPKPRFATYAADPASIPAQCVGAGNPPPPPVVNAFRDFDQSYAWKSNLAYDRAVGPAVRVGVEAVYSATRDNYLVADANLDATTRFSVDAGKVAVFAPAESISTAGVINRRVTRINRAFDQVAVQNSLGTGESVQGIASLTARLRRATVVASYTYDRTRDNGSVSCCIAVGDIFANTRAAGNPNDFESQRGPATYSRPHTVVVSPSVQLPFGFLVSGIYRGFSGIPWTPRYGNDVNGDGQANDRLYVPTAGDIASYRLAVPAGSTLAAEQQRLDDLIEGNDCLREHRGQVVGRNSCRNPWQNVLDVRAAKTFATLRGQNVELVADFFNVLNGLSDKHGKRLEVSAADQALFTVQSFDRTARQFTYQLNPSFGTATPSQFTLTQQFQMQLGLRYSF
jgi:outer membrane receptor protein involved in Fe transport